MSIEGRDPLLEGIATVLLAPYPDVDTIGRKRPAVRGDWDPGVPHRGAALPAWRKEKTHF